MNNYAKNEAIVSQNSRKNRSTHRIGRLLSTFAAQTRDHAHRSSPRQHSLIYRLLAARQLVGASVVAAALHPRGLRKLPKRLHPQPLSHRRPQRRTTPQHPTRKRQTPANAHPTSAHRPDPNLGSPTLAQHPDGLRQRAVF
jgi:hypothetical protein